MPDAIIIGCGFAGAVAARTLAERGKNVLILEKRPHIAGNMYDETDANGVLFHRYGPHIFHTNEKPVFDYLSRFTRFVPYEHRVLGRIDGGFVPIPFNFDSLDALWGEERAKKAEEALLRTYPGRGRVTVTELRESADPEVRAVGDYVYEKVFLHYTSKQWGVPPEKLDASVTARVPVVLGRDGRYFSDAFQYMPQNGYTAIFNMMLDHPLIRVKLNADALARLSADPDAGKIFFDGKAFSGPVVYTGAADELLGRKYGALPYRSLDLRFESLQQESFQPASVVNYPGDEPFTRITEFKKLTEQKLSGATCILREYPAPYQPGSERAGLPFYPIANPETAALYARYRSELDKIPNLFLCGRLAEYKYYNMDSAVKTALNLSAQV